MIAISDIKVGVVTLEGAKSEFDALQGLAMYGVARENIEVRHIPSASKATLMALFFAEYTEVDCVYIALPEGLEELRERLSELELHRLSKTMGAWPDSISSTQVWLPI